MDDVLGALGGAAPASADGILERLLGVHRSAVERQIGRQAGLAPGSAGPLLAAVGPLLIGALRRAQRQGRWSASKLAERLGAERARAEDAVPGSVGLFEELLDADGDGEIDDDVTQIGSEFLSSLFRS